MQMNNSESEIFRWLDLTTRTLVDSNNRMVIEPIRAGNKLVLVLKTNNIGAILGRGGHTIEAIRTLATKMGARVHVFVQIEVEEIA